MVWFSLTAGEKEGLDISIDNLVYVKRQGKAKLGSYIGTCNSVCICLSICICMRINSKKGEERKRASGLED